MALAACGPQKVDVNLKSCDIELSANSASEDDFVAQCARRLVECPVCGDAEVSKKLSAPRLNLGAGLPEVHPARDLALAKTPEQAMQLAWLEMARRVVARNIT